MPDRPISPDAPALRTAPAIARAAQVLVVGGGLAGLVCARTLADNGVDVTVVDKGRAPGGRATSRRAEGGRVFDHGAQFFTARSEWLARHAASWERDGVIARWTPRTAASTRPAGEAWWVGVPDMGALARHLARGLDVRLTQRVETLERSGDSWTASVTREADGTQIQHVADIVVLALPAAQCSALLDPTSTLAREVAAVVQTPCWATMLAIHGGPPLDRDLFEDREGPIAWAAREGSKPGRTGPEGEERWTLHASTSWSEARLEDSRESVSEALSTMFLAQHGLGDAEVVHASGHRWRFARGRARAALSEATANESVLVCGDWLEGARVESALGSGLRAAASILARAER